MYSVVVKTNSMNDSVISLSAQDCVDRANILEKNSGAAIKKAKRELLKHHFGGVFDYIKVMAVSSDHLN